VDFAQHCVDHKQNHYEQPTEAHHSRQRLGAGKDFNGRHKCSDGDDDELDRNSFNSAILF
jgi:hypothetical protein